MVNKTLEYYEQNAQDFVKDTVNAKLTETQDLFLSLIPEGAKVLDYGCGAGRDIKCFLEHGCSVVAIDGSEEMCRYASEYTGIEVKHMLFEELNDQKRFDGIWACASILHVPYNDMAEIFVKMRNALKENGVIYTTFKYGKTEGYRGDRYYTDMDEEKFSKFIKNINGLNVEKQWITSDVRPGRSSKKWLNLIIRRT